MRNQATAREQLHALYRECVNCPNTAVDCPGTWRDTAKGVIPDGFYFEAVPVDVLVVGINTGHPDKREQEIFPGLTGDALYERLREKQAEDSMNGGLATSAQRFSRKLSKYLCVILDVENKDLFSRIAFTNLVKCRTPIESGNTLYKKTKENCFDTYLKKEIDLLKPKVMLALGREPEEFLLRRSKRIIDLPVLYLKHPAYPLPEKEEPAILGKLKEEINYFINKAQE